MRIRPELSVAFIGVLVDKYFEYDIKSEDIIWCVQHQDEYNKVIEKRDFIFNWIVEFE